MGTPRGSLPPHQRERYSAVIEATGRVLAAARAERDEVFTRMLALTGSEQEAAMAVARAAAPRDQEQQRGIAAHYLQLRAKGTGA